ncbi:MAG: DUF4124 domain-containing protein [Pseudomonadota bacterium]
MKTFIILLLFCLPLSAQAGTVYKTIDANGKTVYSDQPPASGKAAKTLNFSDLPSTPLPAQPNSNQNVAPKPLQTKPLERQADTGQPKLFVAQWCGYCKKAKAYLAEKHISYQEYDIDTADGKRAFAEVGGGRGIPVLVRNGQRIQGFSRTAYDALFGSAQ